MLAKMFPRKHVLYRSLRLLGPHAEDFVVWLQAQGYPRLPIRLRLRELPRLDARMRRRGLRRLKDLSARQVLAFAPRGSQKDVYMSALVRSFVEFLRTRGSLAPPETTPCLELVATYRAHLQRVRGLADSTLQQHCATARDMLRFLEFDINPERLRHLSLKCIEAFLLEVGTRLCRASTQHTVAHLRSLLRFLASRGYIATSMDGSIDTPRMYRGELLPRALPWETVQRLLATIDRSTPLGRRDYAMFLIIATYGLRASEIAALRLDDIEWRAGRLRVARSKTRIPLILPLTEEVGAALIDYLRAGRPNVPCRQIFMRVRAPTGPLHPTGVGEAFQGAIRRSAIPIRRQGPHCLRHSLAVHLLRQGAAIKTIGDLLGHRSIESTCVYLRLHVADLRDAALRLPLEARR